MYVGYLMPYKICLCRPKQLLVLINPFGGSRCARQTWETTVRPVFDAARIRSRAVTTRDAGHARALMSPEEFGGVRGVVAVGGDG
jgi:diacylglycerol kinase family enzyme